MSTNSKPVPQPTASARAGTDAKPTATELAARFASAGVILGAQLAKPNPKPSKK